MGFFSKFHSSNKTATAREAPVAVKPAEVPLVGKGTPALAPATKLAVPAASQLASAPSAPLEKPVIVSLPEGWVERKDPKTGRTFFVNKNVTPPKSSWKRPENEVNLVAPEKKVATVKKPAVHIESDKAVNGEKRKPSLPKKKISAAPVKNTVKAEEPKSSSPAPINSAKVNAITQGAVSTLLSGGQLLNQTMSTDTKTAMTRIAVTDGLTAILGEGAGSTFIKRIDDEKKIMSGKPVTAAAAPTSAGPAPAPAPAPTPPGTTAASVLTALPPQILVPLAAPLVTTASSSAVNQAAQPIRANAVGGNAKPIQSDFRAVDEPTTTAENNGAKNDDNEDGPLPGEEDLEGFDPPADETEEEGNDRETYCEKCDNIHGVEGCDEGNDAPPDVCCSTCYADDHYDEDCPLNAEPTETCENCECEPCVCENEADLCVEEEEEEEEGEIFEDEEPEDEVEYDDC